MQRIFLALLFATAFAALTAIALRSILGAYQRHGGVASLTTGGAMQKAAFFLLLCLILYVSVSGAS